MHNQNIGFGTPNVTASSLSSNIIPIINASGTLTNIGYINLPNIWQYQQKFLRGSGTIVLDTQSFGTIEGQYLKITVTCSISPASFQTITITNSFVKSNSFIFAIPNYPQAIWASIPRSGALVVNNLTTGSFDISLNAGDNTINLNTGDSFDIFVMIQN